ncbi:hypothetical protein LADH09A_002833 [Micromonospora sp. LAH09]|uniref:hypothetical protein n=1 Tax=Micromonospora cabrerizensis TaxID=2911213 RepID=UPI001EE8237F|nr:hypothetical protein [Micromonospora cabrerizensis]MCG5468932.1 hypothetical protein [Micromonospora cabrerizensis]
MITIIQVLHSLVSAAIEPRRSSGGLSRLEHGRPSTVLLGRSAINGGGVQLWMCLRISSDAGSREFGRWADLVPVILRRG